MDKTEIECKSGVASSSTSEDIISKNKQKNRSRKRKRCYSSSDDGLDLPNNTLETERNLQASAAKNNLDETSVRKILKKVVTNDHVLALVKLREEEEDSGPEDKNIQPKLTRAKVKELKKVSPCSAPWNLQNMELTPINHIPVKTRPEVKALIAQELPEDEDDEEYEPNHDDVPSDDDHDHSCSDVDSQPRTPATPASQCTPSPKVLRDGPFKVPQDVSSARRKLNVDEEEATIALRTRSKLSLSTTTIEHIESSFVPPDDVHPPVDNLWSQFLSDCLDPAATHDDDDDADPEYNAAADENAMDEDEDLLGSSLIKISKKELNDLVTELFNVMPTVDEELTLENLANSVLTDTSQTEVPRWDGKTEPLSDEESSIKPSKRLTFEKGNTVTFSPGKSEPEEPRPQTTNHVPCERIQPMNTRARRARNAEKDIPKANPTIAIKPLPSRRRSPDALHICIEERSSTPPAAPLEAPASLRWKIEPETQTVHIEQQADVVFTSEQVLILQQQLRMHIQLATSNFMQLFVHPIHWRMGRAYKDYLETLEKMSEDNDDSIVNVCNLKPALQLVRNWEDTVSKDTPENIQLVEFMNNEAEKSRRRFAQNCFYLGDFHNSIKELIAKSPVFLYPFLLPAMPYKADITKRVLYLRSEDELIVLGLDQFWKYMEENQTIFKRPRVVNSRHRWGLATAMQLVCKHMLPWMTPKSLAAHVTTMRLRGDKHNPIYMYFTHNELPTVKHTILPFNPELTLYDQPEHEMPRLWVRYLAKSSKRFKYYLSLRNYVKGAAPTGVPVQSATPESTVKVPLPDDFTREIKCTRNPDDPMTSETTNKTNTNNNNDNLKEVPLNMYKLVTTDKGAFLVPLDIVTVGDKETTSAPSNREVLQVKSKKETETTPAEATKPVPKTTTHITKVLPTNIVKDTTHCTCCILLRKITKKQTVITDFFRKEHAVRKCYCSEVKHPKVTNKLKLLSNNFKNHSGLVYFELERRLEEIKAEKVNKTESYSTCTLDELVSVTMFQLKILSRSLMSKFSYLKVRCKNLLTKFDPEIGDPIHLANALFKTCEKEMVDLYMDFLEFLTPEQADRLDKFKDYFVRNCAQDLMNKVEEQVQDEKARARILSQLRHVFTDSSSSSCQICSYLLESMAGYDALASYTFSLFPHKKAEDTSIVKANSRDKPPVAHITITQDEPSAMAEKEPGAATDCEDDSSSDSEEDTNENAIAAIPEKQPDIQEDIETVPTEIKVEPDVTMDIEDSQIAPNEDNTEAIMITLEEEIKEEPSEWKREEDKLILEVLQQQLTPEERKDNIPEMLEEKNVFGLIADNMSHKSREEIRERVLFILSLLVLSES